MAKKKRPLRPDEHHPGDDELNEALKKAMKAKESELRAWVEGHDAGARRAEKARQRRKNFKMN
jgi:hypothetical protein